MDHFVHIIQWKFTSSALKVYIICVSHCGGKSDRRKGLYYLNDHIISINCNGYQTFATSMVGQNYFITNFPRSWIAAVRTFPHMRSKETMRALLSRSRSPFSRRKSASELIEDVRQKEEVYVANLKVLQDDGNCEVQLSTDAPEEDTPTIVSMSDNSKESKNSAAPRRGRSVTRLFRRKEPKGPRYHFEQTDGDTISLKTTSSLRTADGSLRTVEGGGNASITTIDGGYGVVNSDSIISGQALSRQSSMGEGSVREVQDALREMEKELKRANRRGKSVSRAKVMDALLNVVDSLEQENQAHLRQLQREIEQEEDTLVFRSFQQDDIPTKGGSLIIRAVSTSSNHGEGDDGTTQESNSIKADEENLSREDEDTASSLEGTNDEASDAESDAESEDEKAEGKNGDDLERKPSITTSLFRSFSLRGRPKEDEVSQDSDSDSDSDSEEDSDEGSGDESVEDGSTVGDTTTGEGTHGATTVDGSEFSRFTGDDGDESTFTDVPRSANCFPFVSTVSCGIGGGVSNKTEKLEKGSVLEKEKEEKEKDKEEKEEKGKEKEEMHSAPPKDITLQEKTRSEVSALDIIQQNVDEKKRQQEEAKATPPKRQSSWQPLSWFSLEDVDQSNMKKAFDDLLWINTDSPSPVRKKKPVMRCPGGYDTADDLEEIKRRRQARKDGSRDAPAYSPPVDEAPRSPTSKRNRAWFRRNRSFRRRRQNGGGGGQEDMLPTKVVVCDMSKQQQDKLRVSPFAFDEATPGMTPASTPESLTPERPTTTRQGTPTRRSTPKGTPTRRSTPKGTPNRRSTPKGTPNRRSTPERTYNRSVSEYSRPVSEYSRPISDYDMPASEYSRPVSERTSSRSTSERTNRRPTSERALRRPSPRRRTNKTFQV